MSNNRQPPAKTEKVIPWNKFKLRMKRKNAHRNASASLHPLGWLAVDSYSSAKVVPIHIGTDVLTSDCATAFPFDSDNDAVSNSLLGGNCLPEIADGRPASNSEADLVGDRKIVQVGAQLFHMAQQLPMGNVLSIPVGNLPSGKSCQDSGVEQDYYRLRQQLVEELIKHRYADSKAAFAQVVDIAPATVSRWFMRGKGRKNIGEDIARKIEKALGLPGGSLVLPEINSRPQTTATWADALTQEERALVHAFRNASRLERAKLEGYIAGMAAPPKSKRRKAPSVPARETAAGGK